MNKNHRVIFQIIFWFLITAAFIWIPSWGSMPRGGEIKSTSVLITQYFLISLVVYLLFPYFFVRNRKILFAALALLSALLMGFILNTLFPIPPRPDIPPHELARVKQHLLRTGFFNVTFPIFVAVTIASFWELWTVLQGREKEYLEMSRQRSESELKLLRSQINPHFLFNALNDIYALSVMDSDRTSESIMQLSELLRYVLYECNSGAVPLDKEVKYIQDYLALFQLKKEDDLDIRIDFPKGKIEKYIQPMILIPFVENALKHGDLTIDENAWISIDLEALDDRINFSIENSISNSEMQKDAASGIGLENVVKRLDILYKGKYDLNIENAGEIFSVQLKLWT